MSSPKYYHFYVTANDIHFNVKDIINLYRIKNIDSGVNHVNLIIAISKVSQPTILDRFFVRFIKWMFRKKKKIILQDIFFKENLGRDFSSYKACYDKIQHSNNDYLFFQNRSAKGPYQKKWYNNFLSQFHKFEKTAIVGETINFNDYPTRGNTENVVHVQTYAFLSHEKYIKLISHQFPGANKENQEDIILEGEIGLSQLFLQKEYNISCMEWDDILINNQTKKFYDDDIKNNVQKKHAFYHRNYFSHSKNIIEKVKKMHKA